MAFIYQIDRESLKGSMAKYVRYMKGRCVDIGAEANKSRYFNLLKPHIDQYVSLDINPDFKPDIVANAESMTNVSNESFDSLICTHVLSNISHPNKALGEFYRILRQGGHALIAVSFIGMYRGEHDFWRFSPAGIKLLLEESGFKIMEIEHSGVGVFSVVNQMFNRFIKNTLLLTKRSLLRKIFNKLFLLSGRIAIWLDRIFKSPENDKYILNVVVVAKKI